METYKFKEEFEKKLGSDKEAFIKNLKNANRFNKCQSLNCIKNFEDFMCDSFLWKYTPEGVKHWKTVSKR